MLNVRVATIEKEIFNYSVDKLIVKTLAGEITILPGHAPLMSIIKKGYIYLNEEKYEIELGTINIIDNTVQVLVSE